MKTKAFPNGLLVKHRRSAILFEDTTADLLKRDTRWTYDFTPEEFADFVAYLEQAANESWKNVTPSEATSSGADYWEYYDRTYDDNGYLELWNTRVVITAPYWSKDTLYQFNKSKIQSFLHDCRKQLTPSPN